MPLLRMRAGSDLWKLSNVTLISVFGHMVPAQFLVYGINLLFTSLNRYLWLWVEYLKHEANFSRHLQSSIRVFAFTSRAFCFFVILLEFPFKRHLRVKPLVMRYTAPEPARALLKVKGAEIQSPDSA